MYGLSVLFEQLSLRLVHKMHCRSGQLSRKGFGCQAEELAGREAGTKLAKQDEAEGVSNRVFAMYGQSQPLPAAP